jgi:hypothetical protein
VLTVRSWDDLFGASAQSIVTQVGKQEFVNPHVGALRSIWRRFVADIDAKICVYLQWNKCLICGDFFEERSRMPIDLPP